jgi:hypothetical protein
VDADPWISDEWHGAVAARRVFARAARRPTTVISIAMAIAGAAVLWRGMKPPRYEATLFFRLEEGELTHPTHEPQPPPDIRQYISSVALSRTHLEPILRKHRWGLAWLDRDPVGAIEAFREDLVIDVSRNYFIWARAPGDPPRSAQVALSLAGGDPDRTRAVLDEIGDAILRAQAAERAERLAQARAIFAAQLAEARAHTRALEDEMEGLVLEASRDGSRRAFAAEARVAALDAQIKLAIENALALERRVQEVAFSGAAADEQLGLAFQLFDAHLATFAPHLTPSQLAARGAIWFAIALLLTAAVVGAFDGRLHGAGDLVAWGLPVFGALPRFPGDDAAAHRARVRGAER